MSKIRLLALSLFALIALGSLASAQTSVCDPWPLSDVALIFTGGGGVGSTSHFDYCVSNEGNIVHLETPHGFTHLIPGHLTEGYGICDVDSNTAYYDYADGGASSNWGPPSIVSTTPLVIVRTTSDAHWQLTQTFTVSAADRSIKIKMELANHDLQGTSRKVNLVRFADLDVNSSASNHFLVTPVSVVATSTSVASPGIQLRDAGKSASTPMLLRTPTIPDPCNPTVNSDAPFFTGDGAEEILYVRTISLGGSKTATMLYRPF